MALRVLSNIFYHCDDAVTGLASSSREVVLLFIGLVTQNEVWSASDLGLAALGNFVGQNDCIQP
jgi:hypothetical protein